MPAHIGFADVLRTGLKFIVANFSQSEQFRRVRKMRKRKNGTGIISPGYLWQGVEDRRDRREHTFEAYDPFRTYVDTFDPNRVVARDQINNRTCDPTEWELYLKPGTEFDLVCEQCFDDFPGMQMRVITHKSNVNKLKRIELKRQGHRTRIMWSDA
jgi:hypothetical protein